MTPRSFVEKNNTPAVPVPRTDNRNDALWMENVRERLKKIETELASQGERMEAVSSTSSTSSSNTSGLAFQGLWDASVGSPPSNSPSAGSYWLVSVAGNAVLDGVDFWQVGDLAVYETTTGWFRVANTGIFRDTDFQVVDDADQTKVAVISAGSISTATTRTYTLPNQSGDVAVASTNGIVARTGAAAFASRTITGTAGEVDVANGDGVAANPTISLPDALDFNGKTIDGGTYTDATLTAPTIADFTNAQHNHEDADDGGLLTTDAISDLVTAPIIDNTGYQVLQSQNLQDLFDEVEEAALESRSTGIQYGGALTNLGAGVIRIAAGHGAILDNTDPENETFDVVDWVQTDLDLSAVDGVYYIYVNAAGAVLSTTTAPSHPEYRTAIWLHRVSIRSGLFSASGSIVMPIQQYGPNSWDIWRALGQIKYGLELSAASTDLSVEISAGEIYAAGVNFYTDPLNPHETTYAAKMPATFRHVTQNNTQSADLTQLDVGNYDVAGTVTAIPGATNRATIFTVKMFPGSGGVVRIFYGQTFYTSVPEALAALRNGLHNPVLPTIYEEAATLGYIIAQKGATNLADGTQLFVTTNKFGLLGGALQTAGLGALLSVNNLSDLSDVGQAWTNLGGDERSQDAVGGILTDTATLNLTYNDGAPSITGDVLDSPLLEGQDSAYHLDRANHTGTQTASTISDFSEAVDDRVAALLVAGTNITLTYNDVANTLTIDSTGGGGYTDEQAQDAVGTILTDTATVNFTYDDGTPAITADVLDSPLLQGQNGAYYLARANHTGTQLAATISDFNTAVDAQTATNRQPLDATLTALAAYNTNGILTQTAADTFTGRTITGTANEITVTNGNGVSGNPTLSLPTALTFTGKTVTGGTFTTPTINVNDNVFSIRDDGDITKQMQFQLSGITTATTRTLTVPNASGTIALTADLAAYQPLDADLTSWAAITRAAGFDTFVATPSSANLRTLVTDETGGGVLVFNDGPSFANNVTLNTAGGLLRLARVTDGSVVGTVGSRSGTEYSFYNGGGVSSEIIVTGAADGIKFNTNTLERMRIDSSGRLLVGTTTASNITAAPALLQLNGIGTGASANDSRLQLSRWSADTAAPALVFGKSRGAAVNTMTAVASGDQLGFIGFYGADGTAIQNNQAAAIAAVVDSAVTTGNVPTALTFATQTTGPNPTERVRITSAGELLVGTTTANGTYKTSIVTPSAAAGVQSALEISDRTTTEILFQLNNGTASITAGNDDTLTLGSNSTERLRINSAGQVLVGTTAAYTFTDGAATAIIQANSTSADGSALMLSRFTTTDGAGSNLILAKSAGATVGTFTAVVAGDLLGTIRYEGSDGTDFSSGAYISAVVNGTVAAGDVPTDLTISTKPSGGAISERVRITSTGNVGVGIGAPTGLGSGGTFTLLQTHNTGTGTTSFGYHVLSSAATGNNSIMGAIAFGSTGLSGSEKRTAQIVSQKRDALTVNPIGDLQFQTANGAVPATRLTISATGVMTHAPTVAGTNFTSTASFSGGINSLTCVNTSNTASSDARLAASVGGSSAGDPYFTWDVSGVQQFVAGIDNSDSDTWKLCSGSTIGAGNQLALTTDGRLYGTALHNNAGAVTGTTNQYIASGTYTPTITGVGNVAASTSAVAQWMRVGNVVTVSGQIQIDPTAASVDTVFRLSLPIASDFTLATQCGGTAVSGVAAAARPAWTIQGDDTNNQALFQGFPTSAANQPIYYSYTYVVV